MDTPDMYQIDPRWRASHHGAGAWAVEHRAPRARRWQFVTWAPRIDVGTPQWLRAAHRAGILRQTGREPEVARAGQQALAGRARSIMALSPLRDAIAAAWLGGARGADLDAVAVAFVEKHQ
jgi:hypothetical protein